VLRVGIWSLLVVWAGPGWAQDDLCEDDSGCASRRCVNGVCVPEPVPPERRSPAVLPPPEDRYPTQWGILIQLDQDVLLPAPFNQDRNYTMGLSIGARGRWIHDLRLDTPLAILDESLGPNRLRRWLQSEGRRTDQIGADVIDHDYRLALQGSGFTPDNLEATEVVRNDRPYGSLVVLSLSHVSRASWRDIAVRTRLVLGALGLSAAERLQTLVHQTMRGEGETTPPDPLGWHHQISDGGEPTGLYEAAVLWQVWRWTCTDLVLEAAGSVGYYTQLNSGLSLRLGRPLGDPLLTDGNSMQFISIADDGSPEAEPPRFGVWLQLDARGRIMGYNALLQGQLRDSDHTLARRDVEALLFEPEASVVLALWGWTASIKVAARSPEHQLAERRWHAWGGMTLGYTRTNEN
jgi:hypothetical protein